MQSDVTASNPDAGGAKSGPINIQLILLLSITLVAAGLRFYRLADFPPGLHFDEAFHQVEAVGVLDGVTPIYFTENMGMDPLHIYLIALWFRLFGVTAIGGRLISALVGTLTIPATWWLASEFFADWDRGRRTIVAAVSGFVLATLQWHITFSRTGIQPVLVPLLLTLTMACLWRGLRAPVESRPGQWGWFAAAGVFLGAGPYAYSASRVAPLLIVGLIVWLFLFRRDAVRRRWPGLLICVGVSILVFAPLGAYFITHWTQFTFRAGQVTFYTLGAGSASPAQMLGDNLLKTLLAFNFKGDVEMIRNLPGRPALDPYQSLLFWLGVAVCVWRIRRPRYAVWLGWIGVLLLPTILTEYAPHFGRALGVTPAVAILIGVCVASIYHLVKKFNAQRSILSRSVTMVLCMGLIASAYGHGSAYFAKWGTQKGLYTAYDVGLLETAREVRARVRVSDVYLSPIKMGHPILRFVTWDRPGAKSYDGRYCLVLPSTTTRSADFVIVPYLDDRSLERLSQFYPHGIVVKNGAVRTGTPFYRVFKVPPSSAPRVVPQHPVAAVWAEQLGLIGYDTDRPAYTPGERIVLTLYWQSLAPTAVDYTVFTHLLGPPHPATGSAVWAGDDHEPGLASYPTSAWAAGEIIVDEFVLNIPPDAPAGQYDLEVGLYQLQTMQRLSLSQANIEAGADYVILGSIIIETEGAK